jgi:hypothetical protein
VVGADAMLIGTVSKRIVQPLQYSAFLEFSYAAIATADCNKPQCNQIAVVVAVLAFALHKACIPK